MPSSRRCAPSPTVLPDPHVSERNYPATRLRRLRRHGFLRELVRETRLAPEWAERLRPFMAAPELDVEPDLRGYGWYFPEQEFLNIGIGGLRTGIFNVADVAIMIGTGMLIFIAFAQTSPIPA